MEEKNKTPDSYMKVKETEKEIPSIEQLSLTWLTSC